MTSQDLVNFERWFATPIRLLRSTSSGDGAFAALMISFGLFERYVKSTLKRDNIKANPDAFFKRSAQLLNLDQTLFEKFWGMYRDGIQHFLQPKIFESNGIKYRWSIEGTYPAKPFYTVDEVNHKVIAFDPWKWCELVLELYENDPEVLGVFESHPMGQIME